MSPLPLILSRRVASFTKARERERESEASATRSSVPSHSWRNDGEEGLATMDRFKLERGVATSRRRGSRNTRPPLPLTSPTSQKRRTNGKVDGQKGCRKLLAPLERTVDGVSPIRSHGVRFNLRGRAKNTQESCWNVVVRPDANERFNRGIRGSHCRKVATMRAEGEIVLYVRSTNGRISFEREPEPLSRSSYEEFSIFERKYGSASVKPLR